MRVRDGATLRAYVRLLGLSQRELAARAGVGHATVNHLLSGRRTACSATTAQAIEQVLECPSGVFFAAMPYLEQSRCDAGASSAVRQRLPAGTP